MKKTLEDRYAEAKREIKRLKSRIRKGSNHCEACAEKDAEIKRLKELLDLYKTVQTPVIPEQAKWILVE